jgi:glutathione S-transferase
MAEYVDVETAIAMSGLRVVLSPGIPGPWSESAKAIMHVKNLPYVRAAQEVLGANLALLRWTGQATAPVVAWNDEPPRSVWIEQLALFERLAPEPRLIPADFDERVLMYGLANELMGENGFIWNRRHLMVRDFTRPEVDPAVAEKFVILGEKYGYSPQAAAAAPGRCAEILRRFANRLKEQRARGSSYLIGDGLTAIDLYWACTAATIYPLPESQCAMPELFRAVYVNTDPVVQAAADPALMAHRDFIYETHLQLPIEL